MKKLFNFDNIKENSEFILSREDTYLKAFPGIYEIVSTCKVGSECGYIFKETYLPNPQLILAARSELNNTLFVWEL